MPNLRSENAHLAIENLIFIGDNASLIYHQESAVESEIDGNKRISYVIK